MSVAPGTVIDASGDADTNLEPGNLHHNKTGETREIPKTQNLGCQIFGGINITPYLSEEKPVPLPRTFFGQNPIRNISEFTLRVDDADTLAESTKPPVAGAEAAATQQGSASGFSGTRVTCEQDNGTGTVGVEVAVPDENTAHGIQNTPYPHHDVRREPHRAWENYNVHDREHAELLCARHSAASIRSANSSDDDATSDYGPRKEPLVTTYSDELDSPKLSGGRSRENFRSLEAEEIYDSYTRSKTFGHQSGYQENENKNDHGALDEQVAEDLSAEQFRRQLDTYMAADTTDHIRYTPSSSSNESNIHPSVSSPANEYNRFVPLKEYDVNEQESDDDDDDDDKAVNIEGAVLEPKRGPKFVSLPRSGKRQPNRKSCRYWSNTGLMVREPRGPLCLYDEPSSPPSEDNPLRKDSIPPFREYKHPLLRSYNDLRGGIHVRDVAPSRGDDQSDQGHGDLGDAHQKLCENLSNEPYKRKSERTRLSTYTRIRNFFRNFLRKKASESTQTELDPSPVV